MTASPNETTAKTEDSIWTRDKYHLDKMNLRDLSIAYFQYPDILAYLLLAVVGLMTALLAAQSLLQILLPAAVAVLIYPLAWFLLHRFVLHSKHLYKSKHTAEVWARIHYAHHQDPHDLRVLFGALYTTLPTLVMITMPVGWFLGGAAGLASAFAAGVATTLFYEFCHCIQHLRYVPKWGWLQRMKRYHLMHHFRNENVNFGITNFFWDRICGTFQAEPSAVPRSETVFNIGYTDEQKARYPWVAQLVEREQIKVRTTQDQDDISNSDDITQKVA